MADATDASNVGWPLKQNAAPKTANALADQMNEMLKDYLKSSWGPSNKFGRTSVTRLDAGFVMRQLPTFVNPGDNNEEFLKQMVELAFDASGFGSQESQIAQFMSKHDRFFRAMVPKNPVYSGYTFITRPRLCLADFNLIGHRKFAAMRTTKYNSIPFALRCFLDTEYCMSHYAESSACPFIDVENPFLVCVGNALQSISGYVDPSVITETSEGGFFSEDQTVSIGGERMLRTYDLNLQLKDIPGSPISALFDYWREYLTNLGDGSMMQYADAIDANRLDYTVSIYRFLTDRSKRYITRWCKCTGCFPISAPTGVPFNMNQGETFVQAAGEFSIPFKVNRIEYDDPIILNEFNKLVRRYNNWGKQQTMKNSKYAFAMHPVNNFAGVPYIRPTEVGNELVFLQRDDSRNEIVTEKGTAMQGLDLI